MKASNWLYGTVRHTRDGDRTYKVGEIEAGIGRIKLKSNGKYMNIDLDREEMNQLVNMMIKLNELP